MERGKTGMQGGTGESSRSSSQGAQAIREKATEVGHGIRDLAETTRDVAREQLQRGKEVAREKLEQGKERARNWEGQLENTMRQHPLRTVLIAGGAGILLGLMLKR
jgi:ElaB/YqjD/DUF883 family membrane-anchored ribosome-binding protein